MLQGEPLIVSDGLQVNDNLTERKELINPDSVLGRLFTAVLLAWESAGCWTVQVVNISKVLFCRALCPRVDSHSMLTLGTAAGVAACVERASLKSVSQPIQSRRDKEDLRRSKPAVSLMGMTGSYF